MATQSKKKHIKAVSQKKRLFRANEPLLSVFMWGINHTINELSHVNIPVMLLPDDFKAFSKTRVDNHLFNKENMPSHFKVKEYCPIVFRNLRERYGIEDSDYLKSLTKCEPVASDAQGRSTARFLMSHDHKFIIKTMVSEEVEQMHSILKAYHQYVVENHGQTLLPQYLGLYRFTVDGAETYMVITRNVFSQNLTIHKKYDLKGSTVDRSASEKERAKDLPTFKDNDFVNDGVIVHVGSETKAKLIEKITKDVEFLTSQHLMDYSLLVGIHDCEKAQEEAESRRQEENSNGIEEEDESPESDVSFDYKNTPPDSPVFSPDNQGYFKFDSLEFDCESDIYGMKCSENAARKEVYFVGIIDILTHYGARKRTAQAVKTVKHGAGAEISTVNPEQYSRRFLEFVSKALE
ncbi:PREDICTED: phosphatidylinositol 5-phosphate 4-kinase type-2 alpha-like [Priapulus caudatus]|uniref:Phosphatidylinositol 5-phosphate 4-kinase type-2 alpha-like n=1 Tax=Priapulus caudatus TaxID=37621 RepID=A0ABM1ER23_PRICU|nr:PREDICTED: phosphatidylinositol 5-phosphate 4-kinase type-2 alpha-like [Priapulus caudatus]